MEADIENEDVEHEEINAAEQAVEKRAENGHDAEQRRRCDLEEGEEFEDFSLTFINCVFSIYSNDEIV